jgi:uncharacterized protein YoxC
MATRWIYAIVGVLGVALIGLAIFTVVRVNDLDSRMSELDNTTAVLQDETSSEDQAALRTQEVVLKEVSSKLKKLEACLPEVQNEIGSLGLERFGDEYFVENNAQVSSYCSPVVYPDAGE